MRIKEMISQTRRDFVCIYECEHCGFEENGSGYDDENFHQNVVPNMKCKVCERKADESYTPRGTKYPEGFQI